MTWTYTSDPVNDPVDEVHFLCGDTDALDPLLQNEEIELLLDVYPKPAGKPAYLAAAAACDAIASRFGRRMDASVGSLNKSASQQYDHYVSLAQALRVSAATDGKGVVPSTSMRIVAGAPVLGGGGRTVLGNNKLPSGGSGYPSDGA